MAQGVFWPCSNVGDLVVRVNPVSAVFDAIMGDAVDEDEVRLCKDGYLSHKE